MLSLILAVVFPLHCPQPPEIPSCALDSLEFQAEDVLIVEGPWGCDENVFQHIDAHVVGVPQGQWAELYCQRYTFENGDIGIYCPDRIPPVKFVDAPPDSIVTLEWSACTIGGCSAPCSRNILWPEVCSFSTREELLDCMGVTEPEGNIHPDNDGTVWDLNDPNIVYFKRPLEPPP